MVWITLTKPVCPGEKRPLYISGNHHEPARSMMKKRRITNHTVEIAAITPPAIGRCPESSKNVPPTARPTGTSSRISVAAKNAKPKRTQRRYSAAQNVASTKKPESERYFDSQKFALW